MSQKREDTSFTKEKLSSAICCAACMDQVTDDDPSKLFCQSGHALCVECSVVYCESLLAHGHHSIHPYARCSVCRGHIAAASLERILTPEQFSTYLSYVAIYTLRKNERLVSCVACNYCEIRIDDPSIFWCRNSVYETIHCVACKTKLPAMIEEHQALTDIDEDEFEKAQSIYILHLRCNVLRDEKVGFDDAILAGSGMPCPGCKVVGTKDDMCTHMTCYGCRTDWCYVCGLSVDDCDKAPRRGGASVEPIYGHNEDWESNPRRCPMYLSMIGEVDDQWNLAQDLEDDESIDEMELERFSMNKFHNWLTLQKLHALRNKLGAEKWQELCLTFPSVRNCGFTEQQIIDAGQMSLFTRRPRQLGSD